MLAQANDAGNWSVETWAAVIAAFVAVLALVVTIIQALIARGANVHAGRSADEAREANKHARKSADVAEASLNHQKELAERAEEQAVTDRVLRILATTQQIDTELRGFRALGKTGDNKDAAYRECERLKAIARDLIEWCHEHKEPKRRAGVMPDFDYAEDQLDTLRAEAALCKDPPNWRS